VSAGDARSIVRWFVTDVSKDRSVLIFAIPEDQEEFRHFSCTACPLTIKQIQEIFFFNFKIQYS